MTSIKCDRCGAEMPIEYQLQNIRLPKYSFTVIRDLGRGLQRIDLCPECIRDFENWMKKRIKDD